MTREDRFTSTEHDAALYEARRGQADEPDDRPTLMEAERGKTELRKPELSVTERWDREMDEDQGMDRAQSKVDEVLASLHETSDGLSKVVARAGERLRMVCKAHDRPELSGELKSAPSADSPLLNRLHSLDVELQRSRDKLDSILGRLDI